MPALLVVAPLLGGVGAGATRASGPVGAPALTPVAASAPAAGTNGYWWYDKLQVAAAHGLSTGAGVTIGVIDGPVDPDVPELAGTRLVPVRSFCSRHPAPIDTGPVAEHATGIAALLIGNGRGNGPGGTGQRGIAPDATVRSYSIDDGHTRDELSCSAPGPDGRLQGPEQLLGAAIDAAVADKVDLISISLNGDASPEAEAALERAHAAGVLVVASAGNELDGPTIFGTEFPGGADHALAVTAVDSSARPWHNNAIGPNTMVGAPGVDVAFGALGPGGAWRSGVPATGTSISAAVVAGAVALVLGRYPHATPNQLTRHLAVSTSAARLLHSDELGFGIIRLSKLLAADPRRQPDDDPFPGDLAAADLSALAAGRPVSGPTAAAAPAARVSAAPVAGGSTASSRSRSSSGAVLAVAGVVLAVVVLALVVLAVLRRRRVLTGV